eukprot:2943221-Rhodomonas_salina.1
MIVLRCVAPLRCFTRTHTRSRLCLLHGQSLGASVSNGTATARQSMSDRVHGGIPEQDVDGSVGGCRLGPSYPERTEQCDSSLPLISRAVSHFFCSGSAPRTHANSADTHPLL